MGTLPSNNTSTVYALMWAVHSPDDCLPTSLDPVSSRISHIDHSGPGDLLPSREGQPALPPLQHFPLPASGTGPENLKP